MLVKSLLNVFDAYFKIDGKTLFLSENLTQSSIKGDAQSKEIKNGKGNALWGEIESDKSLEVTLESNVIDFGLLALQCGTKVLTGSGTAFATAQVLTPDKSTKKITLAQTPLYSNKVEIYDIATDTLVQSSAYTISGKDVTFTGVQGDVKVLPYEYECSNYETITIASDKFASAGELVLIGAEVDNKNKVVAEIQIIIPIAKPSSSFDMSSQSSMGDANNSVTIKALKDSKGNLGYIKRIPVVQA